MRDEGTDMTGSQRIRPLQYLCRHYIDFQQTRIGLEHRMRFAKDNHLMQQLGEALDMDKEKLEAADLIKPVERTDKHTVTGKGLKTYRELKEKGKVHDDENVDELLDTLGKHHDQMETEEKEIVRDAKNILEGTALFEWMENNVSGLSTISAMEFLGYVNVGVPTAGKVKAYMGLIPEAGMKSGKKTNVNWEAKGKAFLFARNVIMHTDEFYYGLFQAKKAYYKNHSKYAVALDDPARCPRYEECEERREKRAKRLGAKKKTPPCVGHIDSLAKRWLAELLVSHMWEICRRERGWDVPRHKFHIPPKPGDEAEMEEILRIAVPVTRMGLVPNADLGEAGDRKRMLKYLDELLDKQE